MTPFGDTLILLYGSNVVYDLSTLRWQLHAACKQGGVQYIRSHVA